MLPESQLSNVWRSLWAYVESNYSATAKSFVGLTALDTESISEWVEFAWQSSTSAAFVRHMDNEHPGDVMNAIVTAGIFVKPTDAVGRIVTIRDVVVDLLRRPLITVKDWVGSKVEIGTLQGEGLLVDVSLPLEDDLTKWSLGFRFRYLEKYERVRP